MKNAGSLFEDEEKEHIAVNKNSYKKVLERAGGATPFIFILIIMCWNHYWGTVQQYNRSEWGQKSFEDQQENFASHTFNMAKYAFIGAFINLFVEMYMSKKSKEMGRGVHHALFSKVMNAPINLFFDVTPVGKVFSRFSRDINVFNGAIFSGFRRIFG